MRNLLALALLCPSLAVAQGLNSSPPGVSQKRTNYALQSSTLTTAAAATAPWSFYQTTATTIAGAPGGGSWSELTNSGIAGALTWDGFVLPSYTFATVSVYAVRASGTGPVTVLTGCGTGRTNTVCTCTRSDGGSCTTTAGSPAGIYCTARFPDLGTSMARLSVTYTCDAASTLGNIYLVPGNYQIATGTARFSGAQLELGVRKPGKLCVTTTVAKTCK